MTLTYVWLGYKNDFEGKELTFSKQKRLRMLVSGVPEWVSLDMGRVKGLPFHRLNVNCCKTDDFRPGPFGETGVVTVNVPGDLTDLLYVGDLEVKRSALDILTRGVEIVADARGYDLSAVLESCRRLEARGFDMRHEWKRARSRRGDTAVVDVVFEVDYLAIEMALYDRAGEERVRREVLRLAPDQFFLYSWYLGRLKWRGSECAVLSGSNFSFSLARTW